ncbi:MAG: hypothetical protein DWP97_04955, partial [Calditrichaeota bacterium]
ALFIVGCEGEDKIVEVPIDEIPQPPLGVYSISGDQSVIVGWLVSYEADLAAFEIWRSTDDVNYSLVGSVAADLSAFSQEFVDNTVQNGVTYFYAVSAIDDAGQESNFDYSVEGSAADTPRPQGVVTLYDMGSLSPEYSGLVLDSVPGRAWHDNVNTDIYIDSDVNSLYINAGNSTGTNDNVDIQDMGYTEDIYEINVAPSDGWSSNGWAELIVGHTYVIWDSDNFFAKVRVISMTATSVNLEWAFQLQNGNPDLAPQMQIEKPAQLGKVTQERRASASE